MSGFMIARTTVGASPMVSAEAFLRRRGYSAEAFQRRSGVRVPYGTVIIRES
jgi:hypothetical protein